MNQFTIVGYVTSKGVEKKKIGDYDVINFTVKDSIYRGKAKESIPLVAIVTCWGNRFNHLLSNVAPYDQITVLGKLDDAKQNEPEEEGKPGLRMVFMTATDVSLPRKDEVGGAAPRTQRQRTETLKPPVEEEEIPF